MGGGKSRRREKRRGTREETGRRRPDEKNSMNKTLWEHQPRRIGEKTIMKIQPRKQSQRPKTDEAFLACKTKRKATREKKKKKKTMAGENDQGGVTF